MMLITGVAGCAVEWWCHHRHVNAAKEAKAEHH